MHCDCVISQLQQKIQPEVIVSNHNDILTTKLLDKKKKAFEEAQKVDESPHFFDDLDFYSNDMCKVLGLERNVVPNKNRKNIAN